MGHYPPMKNVIYAMRDPHPQNLQLGEVSPHTLCAAHSKSIFKKHPPGTK